MGHAFERAALIYQHATAQRDREVADGMDALIRNERGDQDEDGDQEGAQDVPA